VKRIKPHSSRAKKERDAMTDFYQIRIQGHLDEGWTTWFDGMVIRHETDGTTLLWGELEDQASLHGILAKVRDLSLPLIALQRVDKRTIKEES
jgi:hypothetical protein